MEQRRLRLGDILDDYCPRERRVTNHAVVAMVEEDVKQTRCTTCDAEHAYKGGREPRRRKKDPGEALYQEVLAGLPEVDTPLADLPAPMPVLADAMALAETDGNGNGHGNDHGPDQEIEAAAAGDGDDREQPDEIDEARVGDAPEVEEGPFHRRLIRATLPRPEGQKDVRQVPDFTIRSNGSFRGDRGKMRGQGGNGQGNGGRRFAGGHQGTPGGRGPSNGSARGSGRPGFGGGRGPSSGGPGRGPSTGQGRGPSGGNGRGPNGSGGPRKRSR